MLIAEITGDEPMLDLALGLISDSGCFHMENAPVKQNMASRSAKGDNPYIRQMKMLSEIAALSGVKYGKTEVKESAAQTSRWVTENNASEEIEKIHAEISAMADAVQSSEGEMAIHEAALEQISHLKGNADQSFDVDFAEVFACKNLKVRYGRFPLDSYERLSYYEDKDICFLTFGEDEGYKYCFVFAPVEEGDMLDEILAGLYFERIHIPEFVSGNIVESAGQLEKDIASDRENTEKLRTKLARYAEDKKDFLSQCYTRLKTMYDLYELRQNALLDSGSFYIMGFIPESNKNSFADPFTKAGLAVEIREMTKKEEEDAPVKLKTSRFAEPFSMFVNLYGVPSHTDVNPTTIVALTYTLLFGIMFGDLGQGFVLMLLGFFLHHKNGKPLGRIMERLGVSSMIFGTLYGSVFGVEDALDPVYERLGISFLPFKTIENINTVLYAAIGIGVVLIIISIIVNMIQGIRERDWARALFTNNGLAGLVFYVSLLLMLIGPMAGIKAGGAVYVICLIVLPLLVMFMHEPLGELLSGNGFKIHGSLGDFIATNFFECFEYLLGYATNTLSFVRVGGFVLSHAGMMSVVLALAQMAGKGSVIVMILGNIFVMGLEGLLSGIQVLRLEFYEMFSRYYTGGGKSFEPVRIDLDEMIE
ncbi:MAG: hypothetical protein IJ251_05860 [Oscillospiraceae bacterium]|nr:hypothetical protein [Oscillospiraceae bacterium]